MLAVKKEIVLVKGANNGAIYDFCRGRVYRVPLEALDFLEEKLWSFSSRNETDGDAGEFVQMCKNFGLVEEVENRRPVDFRIENHLRIKPEPRFCWLEINSLCNQRCKHCFLGSELNSSELEYGVIQNVIGQLKLMGVETVAITGGEPLLHGDFLRIVDALHEAGMRICLLTNGTLLTLRQMDCLKSCNALIKIPLFGPRDQHDAITGLPGSYDKTISAICALSEMKANVVVTSTVTSLNITGVNAVNEFCRDMGIRFEPSPIYPVGQARKNWMELAQNYEAILAKCSMINVAKDQDVQNQDDELFQRIDPMLTPFCVCGSENIAISHNGTILPCLLLRSSEFNLGSAEDLCKVFKGETGRFDEVQSLLNFNNDEKCRVCEMKYACKGGGCRAVSYLFEGKYGQRDFFYKDCYYQEFGGTGYPKVNCPM